MDSIGEIIQVLVGLYLISRLFGGGKKKKKVVSDGPAPINQPVDKQKQPGILERLIEQIETAARESQAKKNPKELPQTLPEIQLERVDRKPKSKSRITRTQMSSSAKGKTALEKVFAGGFKSTDSFNEKPTYSEGQHFDTGHKTGHENDPVVPTMEAYITATKPKEPKIDFAKELAGIDLKKAVILNEVLGPPKALKRRAR